MTDQDNVARFIKRLDELDVGARAQLRRNAGMSLAEGSSALGLFYRLLPHGVGEYQQEKYFLVATLFPLCESADWDGGGPRDLGATLKRARSDNNGNGLDRRMEALLEADSDQLRFRLRQAIRFARSTRVSVDWYQLLRDVLRWDHPNKYVQRRWAESYFGEDAQPGPQQPRIAPNANGNVT